MKSNRHTSALQGTLAAKAAVLAMVFSAGTAIAAPDVIVGELPDISNYTTSGPITVTTYEGQSNVALRAYAVGTTSCNLGTTPLTWIDEGSSVLYPVISQNLYRLSASGRFEQIGQSWLKHGFCALNGNICSTCSAQSNPACDFLMPGCSDPYSSGLNGSQGGLGPKREINAVTGAFPSNWNGASTALPGDTTGALTKRLIVRDSDLTTPGASYFVSSHYVHPEDSAAGTDDNNQSYRSVTVGAAPARNLTLVNTTQRGKAAIYAWREKGTTATADDDTSVVINVVDVPGDGRFIVGAKVVDLGAGNFRYEYAIQNYNSHRSGRSFRVGLPAGAVITNTFFNDVEYHSDPSGMAYDGTDWTFSSTGGFATWQAIQAAVGGPNPDGLPTNDMANALRWDAIYSYSFTTNVAPTSGLAEVGLFLPGSGGDSVAVTTLVPSGATVPFTPVNDACSAAIQIGPGTNSFSTLNATTDGPIEGGTCLNSGDGNIAKDIWYRVTNTACAGNMTISLCGSSFDTKIAIYPDSCPTAPGTLIACNDDFNCDATGGNELQSAVTFAAAANASYLIRVGGFTNSSGVTAEGSGTITATFPVCAPPPPPPPPVNDRCADASWMTDGVPLTGSTALANSITGDGVAIPGTLCGSTSGSRDVWFRYRPTVTGPVTFSTCGSAFDTVLSLHGACGSAVLSLPQTVGGANVAQCNDDHNQGATFCSANLSSRLRVVLQANTTYYLRLGGFQTANGDYSVIVNGGVGTAPPANDDCANRAGLGLGVFGFSTLGATTDGPAHSACGIPGRDAVTNDIWFNYPSECDGVLTLSTCNDANFDTRIAVYNGQGCDNLASRLLACSDDSATCASGTTSMQIPVVSGQNYTIRLGGTNGASGTGHLTLSCIPANSCPACPADFDNDGGVTGADVESFFAAFESGDPCADTDLDGGVTGADVEAFFLTFEAGGC
jgi:hypothetical protein